MGSTAANAHRRSHAQMKQMLDDAGRQEYKAKLQAQLDAFMAANPA